MEVILLEKIRNLGTLGDRVKVKPGYGRNFLIPQGKAVYANEKSIAKFEERRAELEKVEAEHLQVAETRKKKLEALGVIEIVAKAGDEGKLFGSIGTRDIAKVLTDKGASVDKSEIDLPEGPLRQAGTYDITIELHSDVTATVQLNVVAESEA